MSEWTDAIVGERMTVDREFSERVRDSRFSNQEWGLVMTATEFEIENADDPETARVVADTSKVPQILPALEEMSSQTGAVPGAGGGDAGGRSSGSGGIVSTLKEALFGGGGGGGADDEKLDAAEELTAEYAERLQERLEANGKWEQVRIAYQE
ncbi:DUF5799 family protein [Candidatus Halobonum tyrrellensis]|uniref:Uncharacterized protein n=1 Tax=Candidatus Halobonum tyrrellensis G22 TaxID=1324957 RepID=V4HE98_9EURY|nr:DUF5799 family protein [Candidatus Halobonum tyrrellensis]ESP89010.1 hypothetical protein K933_06158 [Candidatus Halobonum tyrrellensis G22]